MKRNNIKKDIIWNSLGSFIQAFNSLFFMIIVTRINGIEVAGYFSYGFAISNIFFVVATFGGRGFQITDASNEFSDRLYKKFRLMTTIITLILFSLLILLFKYPEYKYLTIIMLIVVRVFESMSDVYYGILQKNNKLSIVGKSLFFKNIISLIVFFLAELITKNLYISIISWIIIDIIFMIFYDIKHSKIFKIEKIKNEKYDYIFKKTIFYFGFAFMTILAINMPRYWIDYFLSDKFQGIFGILIMPATMVSLLTSFILLPYAVNLSESYKNDINLFKKECYKIIKYIILIAFICIVISYFIGIPILNLIYGINLDNYKLHLLIVMFGALLFSINNFLSLIFLIKRELKIQFNIYVLTVITSLIYSYFLIKFYGLLGGAISYLFIMLEITVLYLLNLKFLKNKLLNKSKAK